MSLSSMLEHGDQLQAPVIPNPHPTCLPDTYLLLHRLLKPEMKLDPSHVSPVLSVPEMEAVSRRWRYVARLLVKQPAKNEALDSCKGQPSGSESCHDLSTLTK